MARPTFDLQSHSLVSDGSLAPAEVVARAAAAGVELLALTDHDAVDGVDDALAAGAEHGVRVTPACELSAVHDGYEDLHVLGYEIDHRDVTLRERLEGWRDDRAHRIERMARRLESLGWAVDEAPLERRRAEGKPIGRPHLAASVFDHSDNAARIAREGHADAGKLLEAYLIPDAPAYEARTRPSVREAIAAIHDAGGVAVWAHPFWDVADDEEVLRTIDRMRPWGLDGVEVFYATHTREQTLLLADRCDELGLLQTGSADFHGPQHPRFAEFRAFELYGREPSLGPIGASAR